MPRDQARRLLLVSVSCMAAGPCKTHPRFCAMQDLRPWPWKIVGPWKICTRFHPHGGRRRPRRGRGGLSGLAAALADSRRPRHPGLFRHSGLLGEGTQACFAYFAASRGHRLVSPLRLAWRRHPGLFRLFRSLTGKQACFATEACLAETSLTGDQARFAAVLGGSEPDTPRLVSRIAQWETGLFPLAAASARSRRAGWECPRAGLARKGHGCRP